MDDDGRMRASRKPMTIAGLKESMDRRFQPTKKAYSLRARRPLRLPSLTHDSFATLAPKPCNRSTSRP